MSLGACTQVVSSAIANDRSTPPSAIASPVPAPLTIESLAGTYKGVTDEQWLASFLEEERKIGLGEKELKDLAEFARHLFDECELTLYVDRWFDFQDLDAKKVHGQVKLEQNRLIFVDSAGKPIKVKTDAAATDATVLTLDVSADGKKLLFYDPLTPSKILRMYVKQ